MTLHAESDIPPRPAASAGLDDELRSERAHLGASRSALRRMREHAQHLYSVGHTVAGDRFTAESLGTALRRRVRDLADDPDTPLFFGRLTFSGNPGPTDPTTGAGQRPQADTDPAGTGTHGAGADRPAGRGDRGGAGGSDGHGEAFHIGRRHVTDVDGEPMVIDWRAPVSRAFYKASVREPMGVTIRRRYGFSGGELTGFEDERLTAGEELGTASRILTDEIERPRVGPMRDIVATIQPEQDDLVRAGLDTSLCVQGAPGTGKTAVGLHRAAFLLYNHRERLRKAGVLVVGPNRAFLGYIAAVLPALGEIEVEQRTVDDVVTRVPVRATDTPEAARIKHDARMAEVLRRALYRQIARPAEPVVVPDGGSRWRLSAEALLRIVDDARREDLPYGLGRERVRARVAAGLRRQAEARGESPGEAWLKRVGRSKPVREFLDGCWPAITAEALVVRLLGDPATLADAAGGILDEAEQAALRWARPARTPKSARFSAADAVLVDEVAGLLDRTGGYGHVVVDEAQDLSPMQCRALARRSRYGSITILGDLAQGTAPWAAGTWADTLAHLGKPGTDVVALTTGFRVPATVLALANRLVPALGVDVPPARSLRSDGALRVAKVSDVDADLPDVVREALSEQGSVAVIAADATVHRLRETLAVAGIDTGDTEPVDEPARVTLVPASLAKGLEYDHVIVVEPAEIVAAEPRGLHRLYVVLTRAVSRLVVLHADRLPAALTDTPPR